jgi:hypothetical protein
VAIHHGDQAAEHLALADVREFGEIKQCLSYALG